MKHRLSPCNATGHAPGRIIHTIRAGTVAAAVLLVTALLYVPRAPGADVTAKRDLREIKAAGKLRVLMTDDPNMESIKRSLSPRDYEMASLLQFADANSLDIEVVRIGKFESLIPALLEGRGDIVADNICITEDRKTKVAFTTPIGYVVDQIVAGASDGSISNAASLAGVNIAVEKGTAYWSSIGKLRKTVPSIKPFNAPDGINTEEVLYKVATGRYKAGIADNNYVDAFMSYCPDVKIVHEFKDKQPTAWALRPGSVELKSALDAFLKNSDPYTGIKIGKGDLPDIKKRKVLRILTRNNQFCYYIHRGQTFGFEHDLTLEFAKQNGLLAVMIVPPKWADMTTWLKEGKGDIIAAQVTLTENRKDQPGLTFSSPYLETTEVIVAKDGKAAPQKIADLAGRPVAARKGSSYWETLMALTQSGVTLKAQPIPEEFDTTTILEKVAAGEYELAIVDKHIAETEAAIIPGLKIAFELPGTKAQGWVLRDGNPLLLKAVNNFFKKERKGTFFNVTYAKYFQKSGKPPLKAHPKPRTENGAFAVSAYDHIIKKAAQSNDFHWCLIAAQIYQESHFDPNAQSSFGTAGLMQLSRGTAREMGCGDIYNPEANVTAGTKYMATLRKRLASDVSDMDKNCFALAAYNAGQGHVLDAKRLAAKMKLNPDIWIGNVEKSIRLLSKPEYAAKAQHGYCKSSEVIPYVRDIMIRFKTYQIEAEKRPLSTGDY